MANRPTVLIDGNGSFNTKIEDHLKLTADSRPIAALSIIGVQSTGKSTLLNRCFGTNFKEMDVKKGMNQTTKGIWVAKCPSPNASHEILVIDTEGSDGSERQDDVKFEKQVALFGLAISNTVIINMKCESVNLNNGASRPLLRIVFEVMIRKFTDPHKVNLVFVLRDKNEAPLDKLREQLMDGLNKIWKEMAEPKARVNATLGDYFTIEVVPLSHYKYQNSQFKNEVASLKERIISSITTSAEFSRTGIAASGFAKYAQKIWSEIEKENDLDLPSYKDMIDEVICNRIAEEKYQSFCEDESWLQIMADAECYERAVQGFGEKVSSLITKYLSQYDEDAPHNNETKRDGSRKKLTEKLLQVVEPTYLSVVKKMSHEILKKFEVAAMDELKKTGELVALKTTKFIDEFKMNLQDAAIKQANWNHPNQQLDHLTSEIACFEEGFRITNELLKLHKKDGQSFWSKFAPVATTALSIAIGVAIQALLPGVGGVALAPKAMQIMATLLAKSPMIAGQLLPKVASIL